jgi:hypothetical protein
VLSEFWRSWRDAEMRAAPGETSVGLQREGEQRTPEGMALELRDVGGLIGSPAREDELQAGLAALRLYGLDAVSPRGAWPRASAAGLLASVVSRFCV